METHTHTLLHRILAPAVMYIFHYKHINIIVMMQHYELQASDPKRFACLLSSKSFQNGSADQPFEAQEDQSSVSGTFGNFSMTKKK